MTRTHNTGIEDDVEKKELLSLLNKAVGELPEKQKEISLLKQYSDLSFKEIAEMLGYPINTVLARMQNAVLNLCKTLSHYGWERPDEHRDKGAI